MAILIYWKYEKYVNSIEKGFPCAFNSKQARLHTATEIGEDIFVVSGVRKESGLEIYLVAHLIICDKTLSPNHKYGSYRILADQAKSKYFTIDKEAPVLFMLTSIKQFDEHHIGKYAQSFQTLRKLNGHDTYILKRFAKSLSLHPSQST